jgi:Domain of unknown function (DUF5615)
MRVALYFDEDTARHALARELRLRGADAVTALEAGMGRRTDEEQLAWAVSHGRAIYSFNRGDFYELHTLWLHQGQSHCGIILSRQDLSVGEQMRRLLRLISSRTREEMRNRVEFLSAWG